MMAEDEEFAFLPFQVLEFYMTPMITVLSGTDGLISFKNSFIVKQCCTQSRCRTC